MTSETQLIDYNRRELVKSVGMLVPNLHEGNFIFLKMKTPNGYQVHKYKIGEIQTTIGEPADMVLQKVICSYLGIAEEVIKPNKQQ